MDISFNTFYEYCNINFNFLKPEENNSDLSNRVILLVLGTLY